MPKESKPLNLRNPRGLPIDLPAISDDEPDDDRLFSLIDILIGAVALFCTIAFLWWLL